MRLNLTRAEMALLVTALALALLALVWPAMHQPAGHHDFADRRVLAGVPYAMDVLSNLPFALAALAGGWRLWRLPAGAVASPQRALCALFFVGLLATAIGSSWYHLQPDDAGLAVDRYAMSIAFAGLLGLAAAGRVSERAGVAHAALLVVLAPLAVLTWTVSGNIVPWVVVQFGGMALVAGFAFMDPQRGALAVRLSLVIAAYAAAKVFELQDHAFYELTGEWLSGHSAKHIVAALAALPVISAIRAAHDCGQNAAFIAARSSAGVRRASQA